MSQNDATQEDRLDRYLKRAVAVVTILGIPAGLYGYFASQHDKHVENALTFYKLFKDNQTQNNWRLLVEGYNNKGDEIKKALDRKDMEEVKRLTVSLIESDESRRSAFDQISALFDEAIACVESGLCDYNTTRAMMRDSADELAGMYGAYILHIRKKYENSEFGTGLFKIRSMKEKCSIF